MEWLQKYDFILGTYESFVVGYKYDSALKTMELSFADEAHNGSVVSLATAGKFLLSSGSDENIKIYDLRQKKEFGSLHHSQGVSRSMVFFDSRYLFTTSDDHAIYVLKKGSWKVEKTLVKHQGSVLDMSIHPTGKLGLSIGDDKKLITWNLIKGRSAYVTNLKESPLFVCWSPDGTHYCVGFFKRLDIYEVSSAQIAYSIPVPGRTNSVRFIDGDLIIIATESPNVFVYSLEKKELVFEVKTHEKRVRCLEILQNDSDIVVATASNDGWLKLWKMSCDKKELTLLSEVNTQCRITCLKSHCVPEVVEKGELNPLTVNAELLELVKRRNEEIDEEVKKAKRVRLKKN